ncbi:uncharacterized protein HMPREF1541_00996 [Cyphellophora europaea CBS 101466]|uniref:chitinase n=1 Tax=Cyphellophora europaea (strain CBS 101466) TaxID=1220924 RepID=W2SDN6_CYPE1|nr:uncharacterized protein HMPREF1541_00996 [Cyphellophora europaea CBS 101466]ETN46807.1 hypothetical protein HMPREF1541_00996 [Cyphellophora europaea CBS 101466]
MLPRSLLRTLLPALGCLAQLSASSPLESVYQSNIRSIRRNDVLEDRNTQLLRLSEDDASNETEGQDASWLHEHSKLERADLDRLLGELGLTYGDARELVKRYAGTDPVCTSAGPSSTAAPTSQPTSTAPVSAGARNMNVVYYAQTPATNQVPLSDICRDPNVDIVILSFITDFYSAGGYPMLNLGPRCWAANSVQQAAGATGLLDCVGDGFANQVAACQQAGKKMMLSVGGAIATNDLPSAQAATTAAQMIWDLFLGGSDARLQPLRPFGPNIKLDGIDIDNEAPAYSTYIPEFVSALRTLYAQDSSKQYFLSAAPQCPRPDQSIPMPQIIPDLDYVFVQFYNNPQCNVNAGTGFLNSLQSWSQDLLAASPGAPRRRRAMVNSGRPPPKVFIGVLAAEGSGHVTPAELMTILNTVKGLNIPNLGGVSYWDGAYQALSGQGGQKSYAEVVRETLA